MNLQSNFDLAPVTTFHIPARARYYASYSSVRELADILAMPEVQGLPVLHMGGGSNLLFTCDYPGIVLHSAVSGITFAGAMDLKFWLPPERVSGGTIL